MNINLRRAAALQNTIQEVIRTMNPVTTIHLNEFQDPELTIAQAHAELTKNLERRDSLIMALYEIRRLAGDANRAAGIDRRLTDAALLEKQIGFYTSLGQLAQRQPEAVIRGQLDKIRATQHERVKVYGHSDTVETTVFTREHLEDFRRRVAQNRRARQALLDQILELNVRTEITLSDETEAVLRAENLI